MSQNLLVEAFAIFVDFNQLKSSTSKKEDLKWQGCIKSCNILYEFVVLHNNDNNKVYLYTAVFYSCSHGYFELAINHELIPRLFPPSFRLNDENEKEEKKKAAAPPQKKSP